MASKRLATTSFGHMSLVGRQPMQCKCAWCGAAFYNDIPCFNDEAKAFLRGLLKEHKNRWKAEFRRIATLEVGRDRDSDLARAIVDVNGKLWIDWFSWARIQEIDDAISRRERVRSRLERKIDTDDD